MLLVLELLRKNYIKLCQCLPRDYVTTVDIMQQYMPSLCADHFLSRLETLPSVELINAAIIGQMMCAVKIDSDILKMCKVLENMCDINAKPFVEALRHGI